jgi:hypothetical protein
MSEFNFFFGLIPDGAYKYIVAGLIFLLVFKDKIPVINKIDVTIKLPEEFMRHFRWITPLMIAGLYIWAAMIYLALNKILLKMGSGG